MLTFPVTFWGGSATRTFENSNSTAGSATSFTFNSVPLGTAIGTSLVVLIAFGANNGGSGNAFGSATIAGVGATTHITRAGVFAGAGDAIVAICSATTASTTGTIVISFNNSVVVGGIAVYRVNNIISATPTATASAATPNGNTGTSISSTLNIPTNGVLIEGVASDNATPSVVGSTVDATISNNILKGWAGSNDSLPAQTGRTVSASFSASIAALVAAAWN